MEANFYRYESDPKMYVNLNGSEENLKRMQSKLQEKIAKMTMDLTVVTAEIVERAKNNYEQ